MLIELKSAFHPCKKSVISRWEITHSSAENLCIFKKIKSATQQSWLVSHSGFVPSSTYAELWGFFPPSGRFWLCGAAQVALECCSSRLPGAAPLQVLLPLSTATARAGVSSIRVRCATPSRAAGGGEHVEEHFLWSRGRWKRALNGENVSDVFPPNPLNVSMPGLH